MYVTLAEIKKHLNIDTLFTDDDNYLTHLEGVAELAIQKHIDHPLSDLVKEGVLPLPLKQGILLLVGDLYANRESVSYTSTTEVPHTYEYLLSLFKDYDNTEMNS